MSEAKQLNLRYDFGALVALEERGINLMTDAEDALKQFKNFVPLVWAGLLHEDPDLTEDAVKKQLQRVKPRDLIDQVSAALVRDIGENKADDETAASDPAPAGESVA